MLLVRNIFAVIGAMSLLALLMTLIMLYPKFQLLD